MDVVPLMLALLCFMVWIGCVFIVRALDRVVDAIHAAVAATNRRDRDMRSDLEEMYMLAQRIAKSKL